MESVRADRSIIRKINNEFNEEYISYLHFDDGSTSIVLDKNKIAGYMGGTYSKDSNG